MPHRQPHLPFNESIPAAYNAQLRHNAVLFLNNLNGYQSKDEINTTAAEKDIKTKFKMFLLGCRFFSASDDFDELLKEIKPRDDGSVGWYHQLTPILQIFKLIEDGDLHLADLEPYGGLETAIRIALRHDSIEDGGYDFDSFHEKQADRVQILYRDLNNRGFENIDSEWIARERDNLRLVMQGLRMITKKVAILDKNGDPQFYGDGRMKKESLYPNNKAYMHNMLVNPESFPIIWLIKLGDGTQNLSSMLDAPKFTPDRRKEYCDERVEMFGPQSGFTDQAMRKWPHFAKAIKRMDQSMGGVLYLNIGYIDNVDNPETDDRYPLGLGRYLNDPEPVRIGRAFDPLSNLLDTISAKRMNARREHKRPLINRFWNECVLPALKPFKNMFPDEFPSPYIDKDNPDARPA